MKKNQNNISISPTIIAREKFRVSYPYAYNEWKNTPDTFTAAFVYAENWAKLMQIEMRAGKRLTRKLILRTQDVANNLFLDKSLIQMGIDESLIQMAQVILSTCWARGVKFAELLGKNVDTVRHLRWKDCIENARLSRIK